MSNIILKQLFNFSFVHKSFDFSLFSSIFRKKKETKMGLTNEGIIFLISAWTIIIFLIVFCFKRVLFTPKENSIKEIK
jgi:hypothetical protein